MPVQQRMPMPEIDTSNDISNSIYKAAHNIRESDKLRRDAEKDRLETDKLKKENAALDIKNSPENQNYLKQIRDAELIKKQTDAKKAGLDIYTQRLAAVRDVDDFSKGLPYLAKDLEAFGEEGSKELMPRITYKTDLSGQKQIPDNEAFLKERDRIVDALARITGKVKSKPGDKVQWTEDVKDEATGKMKTVDVTKVMQEDGTWTTYQATHGGIKDAEGKAPDVKNFQIGDREVPHQWDEAKKEWTPIKGKGGPKWNPKEEKPEMTEPQARERLFQLNKWEAQIAKWEAKTAKTGNFNEFLVDMIKKDSSNLAKQMQGADETEAKNFIKEQRDYYKGFLKPGKKVEPAPTKSNVTHTYVPGKGFVPSSSKQPPAGYKDTGKTSGGKKVYSNGINAWME